jgi:putative pyruvate formate lyase activating enzyme
MIIFLEELVLPHNFTGTPEVTRFLAQEISPDTCVNILEEHRSALEAHEHLWGSRRITGKGIERHGRWTPKTDFAGGF